MIEGLKLTMTGVQLRTNLEGRIDWHQGEIRRMTKQLQAQAAGIQDALEFPSQILEYEIERTKRQIEVLSFIRAYIVADEMYRLGEFDLRFADLLPEEDPWDCGCDPPGVLRGGSLPKKVSEPH